MTVLNNGLIIEGNRLVSCDSQNMEITLPDNVTVIGKYAFAMNDTLETVIMPSVKVIEKGAFFECSKLNTVIAEKVISIGISAFENCVGLTLVTLGAALKKVSEYAFEKCNNMSFEAPANSYAEKYAALNDIYFKAASTDNEKISVKSMLELAQKQQKIKPMLNLNMIILGGSGTGKSRFYVKPNLMQCNTSFVVTDPSGELVRSCGKMLERMGYKIKVFNIDDMTHSNNYNPFRYIHDVSADDGKGEISQANVMKMINVLMANTKGEGEGGDPFWDNATKLLLSALCFLLVETAPEEEQNFSSVLELLHKAHVNENKPDEKSQLDLIFEQRAADDEDALSVQFYGEFKQAAGKTMQSILISTVVRLQSFKLVEMKNLTSTDNIHLETLGDEKTALFIIIPSTDTTNNFLAAMMYTQLFDTLYGRAIRKHNGRLPIHVRFILDEFANIGKIPDFEKVLATCRKFEISAVVILQNITQLKRLYEKGWEELPGNCDTMIYLGGKDQFTNEYIMKELGKETIDTLAINKTKSRQGSTSYNDGIMGRELMQINELSTMDNSQCIVMVRGLNPFLTEKFDIKNHKRYNMLDEANPERNTYYLNDNIITQAPAVAIEFDDFFDDNIVLDDNEVNHITINMMSEEDEPLISVKELRKHINIPQNIIDMFAEAEFAHKKILI